MHFTAQEFKSLRRRVYSARCFGALATGLMVIPVAFIKEFNWWIAIGVAVAVLYMFVTERGLSKEYRTAAHVLRVVGIFWSLLHDNEDGLGIYDVPRNTTLLRFEVDFIDGHYALTLHFKDGDRHEYAVYMDGVVDITDGSVSTQDLNLLENSVAAFIADVQSLDIQSSARFPEHQLTK